MNLDLMLEDHKHEVQRENIKETIELLQQSEMTDKKQILNLLVKGKYGKTFEPGEIKELIQEVEDEKINK